MCLYIFTPSTWQVPSKPEALSRCLSMNGGGICQRGEQTQVGCRGVCQAPQTPESQHGFWKEQVIFYMSSWTVW